jgi:hypothetical protein
MHEQVNHHRTIRQMLGDADFFYTQEYLLQILPHPARAHYLHPCRQTLKDNVRLLTLNY